MFDQSKLAWMQNKLPLLERASQIERDMIRAENMKRAMLPPDWEYRQAMRNETMYRRLPLFDVAQRIADYAQYIIRPQVPDYSNLAALAEIGPGSLHGDLCLAQEGDEKAAIRLAGRLENRWKLYPKERAALAQMARKGELSPDSRPMGFEHAKHVVLSRAVIEVTQWMMREVAIYLKEGGYIKNEDGTTRTFIPGNNSPRWYWAWVRYEVPRAAKAHVLGVEYTPRQRQLKRYSDLFTSRKFAVVGLHKDHEADDWLTDLLERDEREQRLQAILDHSTSKQREFLEAMLATGSTAEAARSLGMEPNAGDQMMRRIRERQRVASTA